VITTKLDSTPFFHRVIENDIHYPLLHFLQVTILFEQTTWDAHNQQEFSSKSIPINF
jgi:hypothetical protein